MNRININNDKTFLTLASQFMIRNLHSLKSVHTIDKGLTDQLDFYLSFITNKTEKDKFFGLRNTMGLDHNILAYSTKNWNTTSTTIFHNNDKIKKIIEYTKDFGGIYLDLQQLIEQGITVTKEFIQLFFEKCSSIYHDTIKEHQEEIITTISTTLKKKFENFKNITNKEDIARHLSNILGAAGGFWKSLNKDVRYGIILAFITALMMFSGRKNQNNNLTESSDGISTTVSIPTTSDTLSINEGWSNAGNILPGDQAVDTKELDPVDKKSDTRKATIDKPEGKITFATKKTKFEKVKKYLNILNFTGRTDRENGTPACSKSARLTLERFKIKVPQKGSAIDVYKFYKNTSNAAIQEEYDEYVGKAVGKDLKPHFGTYLQQLENQGAKVVDIYITSPNTYKKYYTKTVKGKKVRKSKRVTYGHRVVGVYGKSTKERYIVDAYNGFKKPVRREDFQERCYKKNRHIQSIAGFESDVSVDDKELVGAYKKKKILAPKDETREYQAKNHPKTEPNFAPTIIGSTKGSLLSYSRFKKFQKEQLEIIESSAPYIAKNLKTKKRVWNDNVGEIIEDGINKSSLPKKLARMYRGIVLQESKGDYDAKNGSYKGLGQIGKDDAEFIGMDPDDRFDPSKSVEGSLELLSLKYRYLQTSKPVQDFMKKYQLDNDHFLYPLVVNSYCAGEGTMEKIVQGVSGKKHKNAIHSYIKQHGKRGAMLYVMDKGHSYSRIYNNEKKNYVPSVVLRTEHILGNQPVTTLMGP